jgi:GNAT superfamily N-acetyltransferase
MDQGVGPTPLPALGVLVEAADAGLHPWVREHIDPAVRRAALAEELGFWLNTAARDLSYATAYAAAAPQSGEPPEAYLDRWLPLGTGCHVLAGPRYLGRDPDLPFVAVVAADRPLIAADTDALAGLAVGHFAAFRPGFVMVTTADPVGAWPGTHPEMRQVVGRLADLRRAGAPASVSPDSGVEGSASPGSGSGVEASPALGSGVEVSPASGSGVEVSPALGSGVGWSGALGSGVGWSGALGSGVGVSGALGSGVDLPAALTLSPCAHVDCYERYAAIHRRHVEREPGHARHARLETREDLRVLADGGTLFDVLVGGVWAGLVAAEPGVRGGVRGFTVVELILDDSYRGKGYGRHLSSSLATALAAGDEDLCLLGTIHYGNVAAYRAALRAGRVDVGGEIVIPL